MTIRSNEEWIRDLNSMGEERDIAIEDLRIYIIKSLPYAITKWLSQTSPYFNSLIEEVAQDTVLRVLDKIESFMGKSHFTTWVSKIAVRNALTELRRKKWRDYSLDEILDNPNSKHHNLLLSDQNSNPDIETEKSNTIETIQNIIDEELSEKQKEVMIAIIFQGVPIEEVAVRLDTNRNALYKTMHDARLRIKKHLEKEGLSVEEILASYG
jgi:RNA polymerase sigma-70 factor (ECF subfamily)